MPACTVLLPRMSDAQIDRILNGAAHALWPTLAPLIHDMLMKGRR
jgi:hypothetical protein